MSVSLVPRPARAIRHRDVFLGCLSAFFGFLLLGCGSDDPAGTAPDVTETSPAAAQPAEALTIRYSGWTAIRDEVVGKGRVTVIDFWSLSCPPCLKELPELAELNRESGEQLECVGVAVDFDGRKSKPPEAYEPKIRGVLESMDATFTNYICQTPSDEVFADLEIPSIPAVFVYDGRGELIKRFVDAGETQGFTYQKDVIPFLENL